jgi:hypothetical protein
MPQASRGPPAFPSWWNEHVEDAPGVDDAKMSKTTVRKTTNITPSPRVTVSSFLPTAPPG